MTQVLEEMERVKKEAMETLERGTPLEYLTIPLAGQTETAFNPRTGMSVSKFVDTASLKVTKIEPGKLNIDLNYAPKDNAFLLPGSQRERANAIARANLENMADKLSRHLEQIGFEVTVTPANDANRCHQCHITLRAPEHMEPRAMLEAVFNVAKTYASHGQRQERPMVLPGC